MGCASSATDSSASLSARDSVPFRIPKSGSLTHLSELSVSLCLALSREERRLVTESWNILKKNSQAVGKRVFLRIFEIRPQIKNLFDFRDEWGDALLKHPQFIAHAQRFMTVIGEVVSSLSTNAGLPTVATPRLHALGQSHTRHKGFTPDYFNVFYKSMCLIWSQELNERYRDATRHAWETLMEYVIEQMRDGYNSGTPCHTPVHN